MSVYVTDTHPLVWYATRQHAKLSVKVLRAFETARDGQGLIYLPELVLLEISRLVRGGRVRLPEPFEWWAKKLASEQAFSIVPLDLKIITEAMYFIFNDDPFDAVITATAKVKDLPLITKDQAITDAGVVETFW